MSKLVKNKYFTNMVELYDNLGEEKLGVFQELECLEHGTEWHFTDSSGSDNCMGCIREMCEPKVGYIMPGFDNLKESIDKLTIVEVQPNE